MIILVIAGLILLGNITNAKERDPLVMLLVKKGIITEEEIREIEAEIQTQESDTMLSGPEVQRREELGEESGRKLANKMGNGSEMNGDIKSLKLEVKDLYGEIENLKTGRSLVPESVKAGFGELKIEGLLQLWYFHDETSGKGEGKADSFRLRRTELMFSGKILPEAAWTVMFDLSKALDINNETIDQETRILQDFNFDLGYIPHHVVSVGQFKLPLTEEGLRSSVRLDTIERSFIGRTFGDHRDIGIQLRGEWKYVDYWLGAFNGSGQNRLDVNDYKDLSGRIVFKPIDGLEIGMSGLTGKNGEASSDRNRIGGEIRYEYNDLSLKGEYMKAKDSKLEREGWYAQIGYFLPFKPELQGVFKYDEFENDDNKEERHITLGLNYFIKEDYFKLQINYVHRDESKNEKDNDQVITALQIAF